MMPMRGELLSVARSERPGLRGRGSTRAVCGLAVLVTLCVSCSDTSPGPAPGGASGDRAEDSAATDAREEDGAPADASADDVDGGGDDAAVVDGERDGADGLVADGLEDSGSVDLGDSLAEPDVGPHDAEAEAADSGEDVAACTVEPMDAIYEGFLPPNPYGSAPQATDCVTAEHDVIIVLGCPNQDSGEPAACQTARADIAVDLMEAGYGRRFITSGGAVHNAFVEADTLAALLVERGVASEQIWVEDRAEHTDENIYFSSQIMLAEGWRSAMVVSDDPGHLIMTAVCDSNCCVELGRLTVFEFPVEGGRQKAGHYVLYPDAEGVSGGECAHIQLPTKLMCLNLGDRRACRDDFRL